MSTKAMNTAVALHGKSDSLTRIGRTHQKIAQFHRMASIRTPDAYSISALSYEAMFHKRDQIQSEVDELTVACRAGDFVEQIDALADIVYFCYDTARRMGVNLDVALREVHASNMTKKDPILGIILSDTGKVLKGAAYVKPDIMQALSDYESLTWFGEPAKVSNAHGIDDV